MLPFKEGEGPDDDPESDEWGEDEPEDKGVGPPGPNMDNIKYVMGWRRYYRSDDDDDDDDAAEDADDDDDDEL